MKMKTRSSISSVALGIATLALAFSPANQAQAATITTLFNTGVDDSGAVVTDNASNDTHYSLTSVPSGSTASTVIRTSGFPLEYYLAGNTASAWIGPNNNTGLVSPGGQYTYQTTFDLSGFDVSTASIIGKWSADDSGSDILLNGQSIGSVATVGQEYFTPSFTLNNSFLISGVNTLQFIVNNSADGSGGPTPTALRVEFSNATADLASTAVPEPSDLMGTAFAFGSVVFLKRKMTKKNIKL